MSGRHAFHRFLEALRRRRSPCDGCEYEAECAELHLACEDFTAWVHRGVVRRQQPERRPSREVYERVFGDEG